MNAAQLEDLKRFAGFGPEDVDCLRALAEPMTRHLPGIADRFYARLTTDETAQAVLAADGSSLDRLKAWLVEWLRGLFEGPHDDAYFERRMAIGRSHVQSQMPEHLLILAMSVLRSELIERVSELRGSSARDPQRALCKLLDLELTLMLRSYHEEAASRIRRAERAEMEARLAESEHMANVGQWATTLAHEIKNPLAGISGAIQVIGNTMSPGSPHKEVIAEILSEIDRLDATARDLLIYARPKPPLRRRARIGEMVGEAVAQLSGEPAMRGIGVRCEGLESPAEARIDATQFRQVISNLLLNAAHACEKGAEVTFRVFNSGGIVRIEVIDTGAGIPPEVVPRCFEPFYTSKAKGTGLGLSICKWIVESHGGTIHLDSEVGQGTTITIELPEK